MKYYIPISSLNLDNILQAESISPSSFYARRKTGYNDFEVISEFRGINQIVLFEYPVRFSINDLNRYNFPILIEIEDEQQLCNDALQHGENGLCLYSKTLYLTPYNCRIFFFSERAFELITINTKANKTLKYYDKYRIYPTAKKLGELKNMPLVKAHSDQTVGDSNETQNDKKKGVLYAYLVGQSLSSTPELARQKYLMQEIYNTYAGINAFLKTNQRVPDIYIKKLAEQLEAYKAVDQIECKNQSIFKECLKKDTDQYEIGAENLIKLLKSWGQDVWDFICRKLSNRYNASILPLVSELHSSNDYAYLIEQVERHTAQSIASYKNEMPNPSLTTIKVDDKSISIEGKELLNIAINYVIDSELTQDKLAANRAEICSKIINQIKDYFITKLGYSEEQWKEDSHRQYALRLYNNIAYRDPFSLNDAIELKYGAEFMAIAAFLLRGDGIDSYLKYLLKNEVADYSMPLALWGALCGYMEMNRDRMSEFLTDETYENVYEHLYGMTPYKAIFNDVACPLKGDGLVQKDDFLFVVERAKIKLIFSKLEKSLNNSEFITIQDVNEILNRCTQKQQKQCDKARQIFDRIARKEYNELEKLLTKEIWPEVAERFGIQVATSNKAKRNSTNRGGKESQGNDRDRSNNSTSMLDLFTDGDQSDEGRDADAPISKISPLLIDKLWIEECAALIDNTKSKNKFIEDMNWFVGNHDEWYIDKNGNQSKGRYHDEDKSNEATLIRLDKHMHYKLQHTNPGWLQDIYKNIPINSIMSYLRHKYGNR